MPIIFIPFSSDEATAAIFAARTGQEVISNAFIDIGVLAPGETLNSNDAAIGLSDLQQFMDSLGAKRLTMYQQARGVLPLTSGQQNYTIGIDGQLNTARPQWIDHATCQRISAQDTFETPVHILSDSEYAAIRVKAIATGIVTEVFYDHGWNNGLGNVTVYPYPNIAGLSLVLYGPMAVSGFADLTTPYSFPSGYAEMLEYNLAVRLSVKYPKGQVSPLLMKLARDSHLAIMTANVRPEVLQLDPMLTAYRRNASYQGVIDGQ